MKLGIVTTEFPPGPGGIGTHAFELANGLKKLGIQVTVLCPGDYSDWEAIKSFDNTQNFNINRWPSHRLFPIKILSRVAYTINKCKQWELECLLSSGSRGILYSMMAGLILKIPYIAIGHGSEFCDSTNTYNWLLKRAFNLSLKTVCVSEFTRKIAIDFGVKPHKVKVIHNGADSKVYRPGIDTQLLRDSLGLKNKKIILTVGNVTERKAQDIVIKALPQILQKCPDAFYLVVGMPTRRTEYEKLAEKIGVRDKIHFTGSVARVELCKYYNLCDVFVLNSRITKTGDNEGFGIVLVEAGLSGKPVIGTRGCGIEEIIVAGENGLLVDPDSPDQTANAIISLLSNPEIAKTMGIRGRERVLSLFTWEKCAREYFELISSCLA